MQDSTPVLVTTHQHVLVFLKGDAAAAAEAMPKHEAPDDADPQACLFG